MLIYDRNDIRVYSTPIKRAATDSGRGPARSVAEQAAEKRLLREAFPDGTVPYIRHHASGAPYLSDSPESIDDSACREEPEGTENTCFPAISISHSRSIALLALAPHGTRLGIDTETADRSEQLTRLAPRFLAESQMGYWSSEAATLFWAWTIKEAAYKAAGLEILPMRDIPLPLEVPLGDPTPDCRITIGGHDYNVMQIDHPDATSVVMLVWSSPA